MFGHCPGRVSQMTSKEWFPLARNACHPKTPEPIARHMVTYTCVDYPLFFSLSDLNLVANLAERRLACFPGTS